MSRADYARRRGTRKWQDARAVAGPLRRGLLLALGGGRGLRLVRGLPGWLAPRVLAGEAGLQGLHQVDDLGPRLFGGLFGDLVALDLALDRGEDPLAHVVLVGRGVERVCDTLLDDLQRQLQLRRLDLSVAERDLAHRTHLVGVTQLLHDQAAVDRPQQHEVLLAARGVLGQGRPAALLERPGQQAVGPISALVRPQVVALLEVDRIDLLGGQELGDLDGLGGLLLQSLELFVAEQHVLPLGELVTLDDVGALDHLAVLGADVLLLEPRPALLVQHVEMDPGRRLTGRVDFGRDGHQPERHRCRGDGPRAHDRRS